MASAAAFPFCQNVCLDGVLHAGSQLAPVGDKGAHFVTMYHKQRNIFKATLCCVFDPRDDFLDRLNQVAIKRHVVGD